MNKKQKYNLKRIVISAILLALFHFIPEDFAGRPFLYIIPYIIIGHDILKKAWKGVKNRQPFDENFLMAVATLGAMALGEFTEGAAVMLFYQIGELFQSYAVGKSRRNISELMDIRPDYANVMDEEGNLQRVDPDELPVGSVIVVQPGEKVPIDGIVLEGSGSLSTAALTGESMPRDVAEGDAVISGCIDLSGVLKLQTTREFGESTVSRILELVENASSRKSRSEDFISRFARYYTPAVCYSALALALIPPLVRLAMGLAPEAGSWIYRALTFLVISCPCALVISIPLSFFAGIGGASGMGILIKGSNYLETLSKVRAMVFDKTGTLTRGAFEIVSMEAADGNTGRLLELAALAESYSSHPIALCIRKARGREDGKDRMELIRESAGGGIEALINGKQVLCGNRRLMDEHQISVGDDHKTGGTTVYVAEEGRYLGRIDIDDTVKETAKEAIAALKAAGVRKTVMLSGDEEAPAERVAAMLGIDQAYSRLLPEDKVRIMEQELAEMKPGEKLAFAGDGINDAPVLARCDVGIAMGALGTDAAIEAADVVLMDDDPMKIAKAVRLSRKCMRIVYENIVFAISVKLICLLLGALGAAGMWTAVFADVGVMVIAVLNAIRALDVRNI